MERASANLANTLNHLGVNTTYISIFAQEHFFSLDEGVKSYEPDGFNSCTLSFAKTIQWIRSTVKEVNPERIIVFNKFYAAIVLLALTGSKYPVFISERSSPLFKWDWKIELFNKFVLKKLNPPKGIIAQTRIAADYQRQYYKKSPVKVIHNVLRKVALHPEIERENIILAVGRFNDHLKGFDRLLAAFALLDHPDWKLVFAGNGGDNRDLEQQAQEAGISERVLFHNNTKEIDVLYARAGMFVIPSRSEGFPNALCEAMAAGLPCIAFDFIAGPQDIIQNRENGIIVKDGDIEGLALAMNALIENEDERTRLGKNAMQIIDKLNARKIGKEIVDFIYNDGTDN